MAANCLSSTPLSFHQALFGMCGAWLVCFLLTVSDVLPSKSDGYGFSARTDINLNAVTNSPWFHVPYPGTSLCFCFFFFHFPRIPSCLRWDFCLSFRSNKLLETFQNANSNLHQHKWNNFLELSKHLKTLSAFTLIIYKYRYI